MSIEEGFNRPRTEAGMRRGADAEHMYEAGDIAREQQKEEKETALATLVKSYLEKQMKLSKVKTQLPIIAARIHQQNTTPELRGEAMKMKEDLEAEIYALEFEQKQLAETIKKTGGNPTEYTVQ